MRNLIASVLICCGLFSTSAIQAQNVAIIQGDFFYTPNLRTALEGHGLIVSEITGPYTAAMLAPFQAVYHYGNSNFDDAELVAYVTGGGRLVETPWFWLNFTPPASLQVFSNGGGADFSSSYPGVSVLNGADPLLTGVSFPPGTGGFNIGRTTGNTFEAGVNQIANWGDGTAMIGTRTLGTGLVIGINMHVITSDTAFDVIDQPWAGRLLANAAGAAVPEPTTWARMGVSGALISGGYYIRKRRAERKLARR